MSGEEGSTASTATGSSRRLRTSAIRALVRVDLPDPGAPGKADRVGVPGPPEGQPGKRTAWGLAPLDDREQAGESAAVARGGGSEQLVGAASGPTAASRR